MKPAQRQTDTYLSENSDLVIPTSRIKQTKKHDAGVASRMKAAMRGRALSWLSNETGIPISTLNEYSSKGVIPPSDKGLKIAKALGVSLDHIVFGEAASKQPSLSDVDDSDWLFLPRYDLFAFTDAGKPDPIETIPMRRDQIYQAVRTTSSLWLAEMPNDIIPDVARKGDILICQDVGDDRLMDGRVYVFRQDSSAFIRRVQQGVGGMVLTAIDTAPIRLADLDDPSFAPVGRILGALSLRSI